MGELPEFLLVHEVWFEPYLGNNARGKVYGPAVTVPCFCDESTKRVKTSEGKTIMSPARVYVQREWQPAAPPESRVTLPSGATAQVHEALDRNGGGLPTPDHIEIVCE